jgi:predicted transcriptional regulator
MPGAVLISIYPRYAEAIRRGEKQVEFRKVRFKRPIKHLVVYATAPVSAVVAVAEVAGMDEGSPATIWEQWSDVGSITRDDFFAYFEGSDCAVAIELGQVRDLAADVDLQLLFPGRRAPQSFAYLREDETTRALELT